MVKDDRCPGRGVSPAQISRAPPRRFAELWSPQHPTLSMRDRDRFELIFGQLILS